MRQVKHLTDAPLHMESKAWERVERSHGAFLEARNADVARKPRVMMAALICAKREHVYQADTLSMMLTTDQWIPLDGLHELPQIEALPREQRAFMRPPKYDGRTAARLPERAVAGLRQGAATTPCGESIRRGKEEGAQEEGGG